MFRFLKGVVRSRSRSRSGRPSGRADSRLRVEPLESRLALTTFPITDMTELALLYPPHPGPSILAWNFDGGGDILGEDVTAYNGTTNTSGDPDQDIQQVLLETAEIFAPFDVQVCQIEGPGSLIPGGGHSTIFVGDNTCFGQNDGGVHITGPDYHVGELVRPNSHDLDIAFVDPVNNGDRTKDRGITRTVQGIAHEAGHTFGLAHVRTVGADFGPPLERTSCSTRGRCSTTGRPTRWRAGSATTGSGPRRATPRVTG